MFVMKVVVDTSVWSLALRRDRNPEVSLAVPLLRDLITDGRIALLGAVRQEILSGIRHTSQYDRLRHYLRAFPNLDLDIEDYELASEFYNICRQNGVQGASTDFLICAAATRRHYSILTTDRDFENFSQHIPLLLVEY